MPMGSATCRSLIEAPVTAFRLAIKKSAYLQYPSSPRLRQTEAVKNSFDRLVCLRFFSISRPKT